MLYNFFNSIDFAWPEAFGLLVLLPLMTWWYLGRGKKQAGALVISSDLAVRNSSSIKTTFSHLPFLLRLLSVALLIVALARPQLNYEEEKKKGEGIDIVLCMDVSGSMLAQDLVPNRLEAAKQVAAEFVTRRPTDRIGVVIFAGEGFTLCPLTTDIATLQAQIFSIEQGLLEDGTAIGDGLGISVERLRTSTAKSKVIILLTDGEDQGGRISPLEGKELAKNYGIRIYTIGIGTEGFAPVPMQSAGGSVVNQMQKVNIDEKLLRLIAAETNGLYFRARDNESLKAVYTEIDKLEKSKIDITALKRATEKFHFFAIAAGILLILEIVLRYTVFRKYP